MSSDDLSSETVSDRLATTVAALQHGLFEPECPRSPHERRRMRLCPICVKKHTSLMLVISAAEPKHFPKQLLLVDCHDFWVDAMWFLTSLPAASDERQILPDMRHAYVSCHPDNPESELSDSDLLVQLLKGLGVMLAVCLRSTRKSTTITSTARFGTKGAWPTSIADILPGPSPRAAFSNLLKCWSRHSENLGPFHNLMSMVAMLPGIPVVIAGAFIDARHVFIPAYASRIDALGRALQHLPMGEAESNDARRILQTLLALGAAAVQALMSAKTPPHKLSTGYEDQINAAFEEAARGDSLFPEFNPHIQSVHGMLVLHYPAAAPTLHQFVDKLKADEKLCGDPYTRFYAFASAGSRESKCWARGCQRYGSDEPEGSKLMRCARCRVFQYCSRECQRAHWTDDIRPHKSVCRTLARIQDIAPFYQGELDAQAFSASCRSAGVEIEELVRPFYHLSAVYTVTEQSDAQGMAGALSPFLANIVLISRFLVARTGLLLTV